MFKTLTQHILDFIFPPRDEEVILRNISIQEFNANVPRALNSNSIFSYKHPLVKELVWQIKYRKNMKAVDMASYFMYQVIVNYGDVTLVPIAISKARRRERGYNQCELIVDSILKHDTKGILKYDYSLLIRDKDIEKQTFKNRGERLENIKGIFRVTKKYSNERVVIIDDVTTTGGTLEEARSSLLKAGFKDIRVLTLAH
jgi:competence protein ComFC